MHQQLKQAEWIQFESSKGDEHAHKSEEISAQQPTQNQSESIKT
jgi:hypothetical protein